MQSTQTPTRDNESRLLTIPPRAADDDDNNDESDPRGDDWEDVSGSGSDGDGSEDGDATPKE